jgi:uncharacterized protein (TIGR02996 family)
VTEREHLLRAILERPDDDAARLVYADKLDESGKPWDAARAEFIRLQVRGDDPNRQQALLRKWGPKWIPGPLRPNRIHEAAVTGSIIDVDLGGSSFRFAFRRGFVFLANIITIHVSYETWADFARACLASQPVELVRVGVEWREPEVMFSVRRMEGEPHTVGDWWLGWKIASDADHAPYSTLAYHDTRADLCRDLPSGVAKVCRGVTFEVPEIPF